MKFWLGIHHADWLRRSEVPMMVSYRTLQGRKTLPRALGPWTQDSGGFTELHLNGEYTEPAEHYAARTRLHADDVGGLEWAAIQDWMCEDEVLERTGLSVAQHQWRTIESLLDLRELQPDMHWLPVLQGRELADYLQHIELYARAGIDLFAEPLVGLGTVCRRQHTLVAVRLIQQLAATGLRLHGFGLKITSLLGAREHLASSDSMSWSLDGRLPDGGRCSPRRTHKACGNCFPYALLWRQRLLNRLGQPSLPGFLDAIPDAIRRAV